MAVERENFLLCLRFFTPAEPEEPLGTGEGPCASLNGDFTNSNLVGLGGLNKLIHVDFLEQCLAEVKTSQILLLLL